MNETGGRVCSTTGFFVEPASLHPESWRVARDEYVNSSGINGVLENDHVGPLPTGTADKRSRFDTVGRTVYFARTQSAAFAEVLQAFAKERNALHADAQAAGLPVAMFERVAIEQAKTNGVDVPWRVGFDWQFARSIHKVRMPDAGWWVRVDRAPTVRQIGLDLADRLTRLSIPLLDLGDVMSRDRGVTTLIAQHIRDQVLDDGSEPLGVVFPSKLAYGDCYAWWDRRADLGLMPDRHAPSSVESWNVNIEPFRRVATELNLTY